MNRSIARYVGGFLTALALFLLPLCAFAQQELGPTPEFSPAEVVAIQLAALKENDDEDNGIAVAYRFASPSNKAAMGDQASFGTMLKRGYPDMINHRDAEFAQLMIMGDKALQPVKIIDQNGGSQVYLFVLSKQSGGKFDECWMTDAVSRGPAQAPPSTGVTI